LTTTAPAPAQVTPGQYYGLPGLTQFMELPDTQVNVTVTGAQASQTNVNTLSQLAQDNIVFWWEMDVAIAQTYTTGTGAETTSPYWPWSFLASVQLSLQSMYNNVQVDNGYDLMLFEAIWPTRGYAMQESNNLGANPSEKAYAAGPPQSGVPYYGAVNPNLFLTTASTTPQTQQPVFTVTLPGTLYLDEYWDMDMGGNLQTQVPIPARVSPQYMAGAARQVTPKVVLAAGSVSDESTGPYNLTGNATIAYNATFSMRRVGVYATENPATDPPVFNWQYQRISKSYPLVGAPVTIKIDESAQILGMFLRFWDPTLNSGVGGAIAITNIASIQLLYGGSLYRFNDTPKTMQRRLYDQHRLLLPAGVLAWDLSLDPDGSGKSTNAYALNTLVTASPTIIVTWIGGYTPGTGSKVVIGYHELKYVVAQ
jgi:hypothetical protein